MPQRILSILILLLPVLSLAQPKLDSLKEAALNETIDTLRFETYLMMTRYYYDQADYDGGVDFLKQCQSEIRQTRYDKSSQEYRRAMHYLGEFFYFESIMFYSRSRYQDALPPLDSAILAFTQGEDFRGLAKTNNLTGALFYFQSEYDSALVYYEKAGKMAAEVPDSSLLGQTINNRASIYKRQQDFERALATYNEVRNLGELMQNKEMIGDAYKGIGDIYYYQSRYSQALDNYAKAIQLLQEINDVTGLSNALGNMANVYKNQGEYQAALQYTFRALEISRQRKNQKSIAADYLNLGSTYSQMGVRDSAIMYYRLALNLHREIDYKPGLAMSYANMGSKLVEMDSLNKGIRYLVQSVDLYRDLNDEYQLVRVLSLLASAQMQSGNRSAAEQNITEAYERSKELNNLDGMMHSADVFADILKSKGAFQRALEFREMSYEIRDSIRNEELRNEAIRTDLALEYNQKVFQDSMRNATEKFEQELEFQNSISNVKQKRNIFIFFSVGAALLAFGFFSRTRYVTKSRKLLQKEKDRSDELLLNILPYEVAEELKMKGESKARSFEKVTVLFTDFKDFTKMAEKLTPEALVSEINICFKAFDQIIQNHHVEKIKTIGDAYMAAGGLHQPRVSEPVDVVSAALEMQQFLIERKEERRAQEFAAFDMRVGIHTGPVVAGIVGVKKFQYDIWGDTVNTASRMESHGEIGKVNVSDTTYQILKNNPRFKFESRGMVNVKGKGELGMWYVEYAS